ncbi:MAG: hypothetical protein PHY15_06810 [Eubacteriales bacterium]|nr:hypothetical protein [Eubacteriales bacterium]
MSKNSHLTLAAIREKRFMNFKDYKLDRILDYFYTCGLNGLME